jgi:hypothetical protein
VRIFIGYGTWDIADEPDECTQYVMESTTQDTYAVRRMVVGLASDGSYGRFRSGIFDGPTIHDSMGQASEILFISSHEVTVGGLKLTTVTDGEGISAFRILANKYNAVISNCYVDGTFSSGVNASDGASCNIKECRFENVAGSAISGYNAYAMRCFSKNCLRAWSGRLSSFNQCVEEDSTGNIGYFNIYPSGSDFNYCWFKSNKTLAFTKGQLSFSHCIFDYDLNISGCGLGGQGGSIEFENCIVAGTFVPMLNLDASLTPDGSTILSNAGKMDLSRVYEPGLNLESNFPDPELDRYCRYSSAGPRELRFPEESVVGGVRGRRNFLTGIPLEDVGL